MTESGLSFGVQSSRLSGQPIAAVLDVQVHVLPPQATQE
jgi:hypothetical protein